MCTLVILRRPGHAWPLLIAANRDEMRERPWLPPGRHWPDRPEVFAGLDALAGGSWLGINDHGVMAAVLNRRHTLGPLPGTRSRGELVLDALDHAAAADAAEALRELDARAYRGFNLVVADDRAAFWLRSAGRDGPRHPDCTELPEGVSMLTAYDLNDAADPRIRHHLPIWRAARPPDPDARDWANWPAMLASRDGGDGARGAMTFRTETGFGTVSSALIAIPDPERDAPSKPLFRFAEGHPDSIRWRDLKP